MSKNRFSNVFGPMTSKTALGRVAALAALAMAAGAAATPAAAEYEMGLEAYRKGQSDVAIDLWRRYALAGDVRSMKALGDFYASAQIENSLGQEIGPEQIEKADYVRALKWYTLAAHHDFEEEFRTPSAYDRNAQIESQQRLPEIREQMTNADVAKAEKLVAATYERGSARQIFLAAEMFRRGSGLKKNNVRAYELYLVASERGASEATAELENMREKGLISGKEIEMAQSSAATWQPPLPEEHVGDTQQMAELKRLKEELQALRLQDAYEAVSDIDVSVLQHSLRALGFYFGSIDNKMGDQTREAIRRFQYSLVSGDMQMTAQQKRNVEVGVLSAKDTVTLISRAAARADNSIAQYTFGIMHLRGIGVGQDGTVATKWLKKAAAQNVAEAHYALGVIYRDGSTGLNAVTPNKSQAALHFAKAASLGYRPAQRALELLEFESPRSVDE